MIRFAVLGGGWRAEFYLRVACQMPKEFEVCAVMMRDPEKAERIKRKYPVPVVFSLEEVLERKPDFCVVAYPWQPAFEMTQKLMRAGVAILAETPVAPTCEDTVALWNLAQETGTKIQVAEQYALQPYHAAMLKLVHEENLIGTPVDLTLSMMHGYHGVNILRRYLGVGFEPCVIRGRRYLSPVLATRGRKGRVEEPKVLEASRDVVAFEFDGGKVGHYDWCGEQYFSLLRSRSMCLRGTHGEIRDMDVRYINKQGDCVVGKLQRTDFGQYSNLDGYCLHSMTMDGRVVYENPFAEKSLDDFCRLSDDEIAVGAIMVKTKEYLKTGKSFYGIADACHDTYMSHMLTRSAANNEEIRIENLPWMK